MSKEMTIIALGIWIVVVPYLGVPGSWKIALLVLSGLAIAVIGFLLRGEALTRSGRPSAPTSSFTESHPNDRLGSLN